MFDFIMTTLSWMFHSWGTWLGVVLGFLVCWSSGMPLLATIFVTFATCVIGFILVEQFKT